MEQTDFSNGIEVQTYFDKLIKSLRGVKIVSVFSRSSWFSHWGNRRTYSEDSEVYILFENGQGLVIFYPFIDALSVSLRPLSEEEKALAADMDYFNDISDIYARLPDGQLVLDETLGISLEYDSLEKVSIEYVRGPYSKWINHELVDYVSPIHSPFEDITFTMANGNSFVIAPDDAIADGYTLAWSEDAQETITQHRQKSEKFLD